MKNQRISQIVLNGLCLVAALGFIGILAIQTANAAEIPTVTPEKEGFSAERPSGDDIQTCEAPIALPAGTRWVYSVSHDVQAALVERLSGTKFEDFVGSCIGLPGADGLTRKDSKKTRGRCI